MSINVSHITTCDLFCSTLVSDDVHSTLTSVHVLCRGPLKYLKGLQSPSWLRHSSGTTLIRHWPDTDRYARKYRLCKHTDKIAFVFRVYQTILIFSFSFLFFLLMTKFPHSLCYINCITAVYSDAALSSTVT